MTDKQARQSLKQRIAAHCRRHSHSIIIQLTAFSLITAFAIYEIHQTRMHVQSKFDRSFKELDDFTQIQSRRIEYLATKVKELGEMAAIPVDAASNAYDKAQAYYSELRAKIKASDWLKWDEVDPQSGPPTEKK